MFSTNLDGDQDYLELIPPAPLAGIRDDLESTIQGLQAEGGTGLYDSTMAAVQAVRDNFDQTKINAVLLLTDGMCDDDPPGCELTAVQFLGQKEDVFRITVAYGKEPPSMS